MKASNTMSQMRKGLLELCILAILKRGEAYPSDIIHELKDNEMIVVEGTLYPLLNRMMRDGYLSYNWRESTSGPPRKYYNLTPAGEELKDKLYDHWQDLSNSINLIINTHANNLS